MEINDYLSIARRWAWLLILGLILGAVSGYGFAGLQTPIYQAGTRVIASRASMQAASSGSPTGGAEFYISDQQLMQTYIELLKSSSIIDRVSQALGYPVLPEQVQAAQVKDTRILEITVEDPDPQRAADIANAVVAALILQNEEIESSRFMASEQSLQSQITQVESQISGLQSQIDKISNQNMQEQITQAESQIVALQQDINNLQKEIDDLQKIYTADARAKIVEKQVQMEQRMSILELYQQAYANLVVLGQTAGVNGYDASSQQLAQVQTTLSLYQQIYINLLNNLETVRFSRLQNTQSINQIQAAVAPEVPVRPQPFNTAMLAGVVGLMLAAGVAFLIEYLDDTLKIPEDVDRVLSLPLIGYIAEIQQKGKGEEGVHVALQPRSPVSESFRSLRTNLEFSAVDKPLRTILVTGAEVGDGKTTIATNLAAIFAQGGKRVLLLDADLRRPRIHRFLGIQNRIGLTDLFRGNLDVADVMVQWVDSNSKGMSVITSGSLPPNPSELLGSKKMDHILAGIVGQVDVVVIDSPPSIVSDAQILASKVDGVLLVVQPGKTHAGAARAMREQLERAGAHVVGAVFNRISRRHGYYYGGYRYYSPYYSRNGHYLSENEVSVEPVASEKQDEVPQSLLSKLMTRQNRSNQ